MANYGKSDSAFDDMASSPAAPAGLGQAAGRYSYALDQFQSGNTQDQPWIPQDMGQMAQNWYTGQNTLEMTNGWDTPFYQKFFAQDEKYRQASVDNPSVYYQQFQNPEDKHTGIALWDDPGGKFVVGDVFVDGQKQEGQNVYDVFGEDTAAWLLGSIYKSGSDNAALFERRDQANYIADVKAEQQKWSENARFAPTVNEYKEQLKTNTDEILEGSGDNILTAGSVLGGVVTGAGVGATGGALLTSWTGPGAIGGAFVGGIAGGIVGGLTGLFGGITNKDELAEVAARAYTRQQQVAEDFEGAQEILAYGHAAEEWSALGMKFLQPGQSAVRGMKEKLDGTAGDGKTDWYGTDENGNPKAGMKWKSLDLAAAVVDSVGQFGTPVGRALYTGTMGTTVAGRLAGDVGTDQSFDEATGTWHEYENWNQRAAAYGSIGIDALQTAVPILLSKAAKNARTAAGMDEIKYLGRGATPAQRVGQMDDEVLVSTRFSKTLNPDTGKIDMTHKPTLVSIVPSEMARKVSVGVRSRQLARRDDVPVSSDHVYQAALELSGGSQWKTALVNAYAEGVEEFTQSYLDEWSYGRQGDFRKAMEAAAYGAASGLGMGLGGSNRRPDREQSLDRRRRETWEGRAGTTLTDEEWKAEKARMSPRALEMLDVRTPAEDADARKRLETMSEMMRRGQTDSPIAQAGVRVVGPDARDQELRGANDHGGDALQAMGQETAWTWIPGTSKRAAQIDKAVHGPNTVTMSFSQVMTSLGKKGKAIESQIEFFADENLGLAQDVARATEALKDKTLTEEQTRSLQIELDTAQRKMDQRERNIVDLNEQLRAVRVLLGDSKAKKNGELTELYKMFSQSRGKRRQRDIINVFNKRLTDIYTQTGAVADDQGAISPEAAKSVIELLLPRHPLQDKGSFNLMLPKVSTMMTRFNSHRVAGIHQAVLKALGADHDGDTLVQQFDQYVTPEMRQNLRRGLQYMMHEGVTATEMVDDAGKVVASKAGPRQWKVNIDLPSSEEAYIDMISSPLNTADQRKIVDEGLDRLRDRLTQRYVRGSEGPAPLKNHYLAFEDAYAEFAKMVRGGVTDARVHLAQKLWDLNSEGMFAMSDVTAVPEITQLWVMITTEWENIQVRSGMHKYAKGDPVDPVVAADRPKDKTRLLTRARLYAASLGQSMTLFGAAGEPRASQFLHYEPLRQASIDWGVARREDTMKRADTSPELAIGRLYEMLGSGQTETDLESTDSKGIVKKRVVGWIHDLAKDLAAQQDPPVNPQQFYLLVAAMEAGDFRGNPDLREEITMGPGPISMVQLLLRRSIQVERNMHRDMRDDDPRKLQLDKLESLTRPRGKRSTTSAEALVEIFADMSPYEMLGEDAHYFGNNLTIRQHQRLLLSMSQKKARREWGQYKTRVPAYFKTADKPDPIVPIYTVDQMSTLMNPTSDDDGVPHINGYTILVDAIQTATSAVRATRTDRAERDAKLFTNGLTRLHNSLDTWYKMNTKAVMDLAEADGEPVSRRYVFRHMLENYPDLAETIAELVPEASREFVFQLQDGHATAAQFMEDVLMDDNVDRAVAQFYVYSKFSEWAVMQRTPWEPSMVPTYDEKSRTWKAPKAEDLLLDDILGKIHPHQIKSRFLETLYYLNTLNDSGHELRRFVQTALSAESLPKLFDAINDEPVWMFDRAELLPYNDSVEDYELMPSDVYATGGPDVTYREQLKAFSSAIERHATNLVKTRDQIASNDATISKMLAQNEFEKNPAPGMRHDAVGAQHLDHLDKALEHARMYGDLVGPRIREQLMEAFDQMLLRLHDKGKSDERIVGIAEVRATVDTIGFGSAMVLEMDAIHAYSWDAVVQSPTMLTSGPIRIMMKDGSVFELDLSTRDGVLEALANPVSQQFAIAVVIPTMRDINDYNVVQMYTDSTYLPKDGGVGDLAFMLKEAATNESLFNTQDGGKYDQAIRKIAFVEAQRAKEALDAKDAKDVMDGYYPIMRMINEILEGYQTSAGTGRSDYEREQLRRQLVMDIGDGLDMIGELDISQLGETKEILYGIMKARQGERVYLDRLFESEFDKDARDIAQSAFAAAVSNMLVGDAAAAKERAENARLYGTPEEFAEAAQKHIELEQRVLDFQSSQDFNLVDGIAALDFESAMRMFKLSHSPGDATHDKLKKISIVAFLLESGRINRFEDIKASIALKETLGVENATSWMAMFEKFLQNAHDDDWSDTIATWDFAPEEWDQISLWATFSLLGERTGHPSSDMRGMVATSKTVKDFARLHDASWTSMLDELFNPKTWQSMHFLTSRSGDTGGYLEAKGIPTTKEEIAERLSTTVLSQKLLGDWNQSVVVNQLKMDLAIRQARSSVEIPKGGDYPKIFGPINGVTSGTDFTKPLDEHMTAFDYALDDDEPLLEKFAIEDYAVMHNHFVSEVSFVMPDGTTVDLMPSATTVDTTNTETENSGLRLLDVVDLSTVVEKLRKKNPGAGLRIVVVDPRKQPFDSPTWVNNRFFDGRGRDAVANNEVSLIASMVFGTGGESKRIQQGPLDVLSKNGELPAPYRNSTLDRVKQLETGSFHEVIVKKAWHLLTREFPMSRKTLDDLPAFISLEKLRHVVVGRNTDTGEKEVWWVQDYIQKEATGAPIKLVGLNNPSEPPQLVALERRVADRIYGGSGYDKYDSQRPLLNIQDLPRLPDLSKVRLERLGLDQLGETVSLSQTPVAQFRPLPRSVPSGGSSKTVRSSRELDLDAAAQRASTVLQARGRDLGMNMQERSQGPMQKMYAMLRYDPANLRDILQRLGVPYGLLGSAEVMELHQSARLYAALNDTNNGRNMVWEFRMDLDVNDHINGIISKSGLSGIDGTDADSVVFGDTVVLDLKTFLDANDGNEKRATEQAIQVVDEFSRLGVRIMVGSSIPNTDLRRKVSDYLTGGASRVRYQRVSGTSGHFFEPVYQDKLIDLTSEAYDSDLTALDQEATKNANLVFLPKRAAGLNEGVREITDRFFEVFRKTAVQLIPTNWTMPFKGGNVRGFSVPAQFVTEQTEQFAQLASDLVNYARAEVEVEKTDPKTGKTVKKMERPGEKELLRRLGPLDESIAFRKYANGTYKPGVRPPKDALKIFLDTLSAGNLPLAIGSEVMVGDIFLTVTQRGELMLQRVGYEMPKYIDRKNIEDQWAEPLGGVGGLRLAVGPNKVNKKVTHLPPIRVTEIDPNAKDGVMLKGEHALDWAQKTVSHGLKTQSTPMPKGLSFASGASKHNDSAIGSRVGRKDTSDKSAGRGTATKWRNVWAITGVDFTQDLLRIFVPDPNGSLTEAERMNRLKLLLRNYARMNNHLTGARAAQMLSDPRMAFEELNRLNAAGREEMGGAWIDLELQGMAPKDAESPVRLSDDDRLKQIFLVTLAISGMKPEQLISVPGLLTAENPLTTESVFGFLPSVFTEAFGSSMYPGLHKRMIAKANDVFPTFEDENTGEMRRGMWLGNDFTFYTVMKQRTGRKIEYYVDEGYLQVEVPLPADENAINQAFNIPGPRDISLHLARTESGQGFYSTSRAPKRDKDGKLIPRNVADRFYGEEEYEQFDDASVIYDFLTRVAYNPEEHYFPSKYNMPLEHAAWLDSDEKVGQYQQPANRSENWPDNGQASEFLKVLNLPISDLAEVDYLVRQFVGAPAPKHGTDEIDTLNHQSYVQAVDQMLTNVRAGMHPLHGGDVPLEHHGFWFKVFEANQATGKRPPWRPVSKVSKLGGITYAKQDWAEWVLVLMDQMNKSNKEFEGMFMVELAGFFHTYQNTNSSFITMPLTPNQMVNAKLADGKTNELYISIDKGAAALAHDPALLETMQRTWRSISGHVSGVFDASVADDTPASSVVYRANQRTKWLKRNGIDRQKRATMRDLAKDGFEYKEALQANHIFLHSLVHMSIVNRLLNLGLYVGAPIEIGMRSALERTVDVLTGSNVGSSGRLFSWVGDKFENGPKPKYTPDQIRRLNKTAKGVGGDPKWRGKLMGETTYRNNLITPTGALDDDGQPIDRGWRGKWGWGAFWEHSASRVATVINDPTFGQRKTAAGKRYIQAVLEYLETTDNHIDFDVLMQQLENDSLWVEKQFPREGLSPHRMGANAVGQVRATRGTWLGDIIMRPVDRLYSSPDALRTALGVMLKIPLAFTRFQANALLTLTGLGALDTMTAAALHDRQTTGSWIKQRYQAWQNLDETPPVYHDFSDVLETFDMERVILRGAVSQTGLAIAAAYGAQMLGLGGEDEEERKRRLRDKYTRIPPIYDPREAENGFEYADAIWLDEIPILNSWFARDLGGEQRSPVIPHWIMRQFTSPLMGVVRAFNTGDFSNVRQGFWDAASVIPHSMIGLWRDANYTADLMANDIQELSKLGVETNEITSRMLWMFVSMVGIYEKALVENQMFNTWYVGSDPVDRNAFAIPETTKTGEIVREQGTNYPEATPALQQTQTKPLVDPVSGEPLLDENGEPVLVENKLQYARRSGMDGLLHQYTETNLTAAVALSLIPGAGFFMRDDMVPKKPKVPVALGEEEELKALVAAAFLGEGGQDRFTQDEIAYAIKNQYQKKNLRWDQNQVDAMAAKRYKELKETPLTIMQGEVGEILTAGGTKGVFRSLMSGHITFADPVLQGAYFPPEMRQQVAIELLDEIVQESIDMGMSAQAAEYRKRRLWFGDMSTGQVGLRQLVYSTELPSLPFTEYTQLNVTYAVGPDGKMWATPFTRANMLGALGIPIPHSMERLADGTRYDTRGNVVNEITGTNTGLKAVVPALVHEQLEPDDSVLKESKDPKKTTSSWGGYGGYGGYSRRGYGGYGGGGGGGYSSDYKSPMFTDRILRAIRAGYGPQMDGSYAPNFDNPLIRRADVRRERVTSERGRLKQWQ